MIQLSLQVHAAEASAMDAEFDHLNIDRHYSSHRGRDSCRWCEEFCSLNERQAENGQTVRVTGLTLAMGQEPIDAVISLCSYLGFLQITKENIDRCISVPRWDTLSNPPDILVTFKSIVHRELFYRSRHSLAYSRVYRHIHINDELIPERVDMYKLASSVFGQEYVSTFCGAVAVQMENGSRVFAYTAEQLQRIIDKWVTKMNSELRDRKYTCYAFIKEEIEIVSILFSFFHVVKLYICSCMHISM